jgi:hypothetical protein
MTSLNAGHRWLASSRARQEQTLLKRAVSDWQRGTECRAPTTSLKTPDRGTASVAPRQSCGVAGREIVCAAELGHCVLPPQPSACRRGARRSGPSRQGCCGFGRRWRPADAKRGLHGERRYLLAWLAVSGTGGVGVVRAVGPDAPCTRRLALMRRSRTLARRCVVPDVGGSICATGDQMRMRQRTPPGSARSTRGTRQAATVAVAMGADRVVVLAHIPLAIVFRVAETRCRPGARAEPARHAGGSQLVGGTAVRNRSGKWQTSEASAAAEPQRSTAHGWSRLTSSPRRARPPDLPGLRNDEATAFAWRMRPSRRRGRALECLHEEFKLALAASVRHGCPDLPGMARCRQNLMWEPG